MRVLLKVSLPVDSTNDVIRAGKLGSTIQSILADQKPEAVYFVEMDGTRTAIVVVDIADASQIPAIAEPYFLAFSADVSFHPAMTPADLEKAGPSIDEAVKKYGDLALAGV